ncbi:MAG: TIM barrel protein [Roseiflexaceae bacterium]
MARLSLTSWSLHQDLSNGSLKLTDLPARMRAAGIGTLELCHFHLPDAQPETLANMRYAIEAAGVELLSVLIDAGDISNADPARAAADQRMVESWIDAAAALGARGVRVVAGEGATDDRAALDRAVVGLKNASVYAASRGIRVRTENFRPLLATAENCLYLLDRLEGQVGMCADIGNFPREQRQAAFAAVVGRAEVVHVKAEYDSNGQIIADELRGCLDAARVTGFTGAYTLVYDRGGDSWAGLAQLGEVVAGYL